jgi:hypothetical protein
VGLPRQRFFISFRDKARNALGLNGGATPPRGKKYGATEDELNSRYSIEAFNNGEFGNCRCDSYRLYDKKCNCSGFYRETDLTKINRDAMVAAILNIKKRDVTKELKKRGIPYIKEKRRITIRTVFNAIAETRMYAVLIFAILAGTCGYFSPVY